MKKVVILFCSLLLLSLAGCASGGVAQAEYDALKEKYEKLEADFEDMKEDYNELLNELAEEKANQRLEGNDNNGTKTGSTSGTNDGVLLYSDEYVALYCTGYEKDKYYSVNGEYNVIFVFENKTGVSLSIGVNSLSLGGRSCKDAFVYEEMAPHSKGNIEVSTKTDLSSLNISSISGSFYIADKTKTCWGSLMRDIDFEEKVVIH